MVTTIAGGGGGGDSASGTSDLAVDGIGVAAKFRCPISVTTVGKDHAIVADEDDDDGCLLRLVELSSGRVRCVCTLTAGSCDPRSPAPPVYSPVPEAVAALRARGCR